MDDIFTSKELGDKLREFRKRRGVTQEALAEKAGVSFQQIQQYENGRTRLNTDKLQLIAKALEIPVAAFFGEVEGSLSDDEQSLVNGFRALPNRELQAFVLNSLTYLKR